MRRVQKSIVAGGHGILAATVLLAAGSLLAAPADKCGDNKCTGQETCATCAQDCGVCPPPPPPATPTLSISQVPLFLGGVLEPNLMLTVDDSNSMGWSFLPDSIAPYRSSKWSLAAINNPLAYDPSFAYAPPGDRYGVQLPDVSFSNAPADGYKASMGAETCTVNLASYEPTWTILNPCNASTGTFHSRSVNDETPLSGAYYVIFDTKKTNAAGALCSTTNVPDLRDDSCFTAVAVTTEAAQQKFANWYSYYRTRLLAAKGGLGNAFAQLGDAARVGIGRLNATGTVLRGINIFGAEDYPDTEAFQTHREAFFATLYGLSLSDTGNSTPLRRAADEVGQYFTSAEPWRSDPAVDGSPILSCRQSYHLLVSDGMWNDLPPLNVTTNVDGDQDAPFNDSYSVTLADVARYYWQTDLRGDDADNVPPNGLDPATWQHLVTFAVGFGLEGTRDHIDPVTAFAAIGTKTAIGWPQPVPSDTVDDFLHAAVNSYGDYVNVTSPYALADILSKISRVSAGRASSAASVVLNAATLSGGTNLFQVLFNSDNWTGEVVAYSINPFGSEDEGFIGDVVWRASENVPDWQTREIVTYDPVAKSAIGFSHSWLSSSSWDGVLTEAEVSYLRGNPQGEGTSFRKRTSWLGDIVNSTPAYVGNPNAPYPDSFCNELADDGGCTTYGVETKENAYSVFRNGFVGNERSPMIYVGGNDGMLHGFYAGEGTNAGEERYAYVPSMLIPKLAELTKTTYSHRYYVDGGPTVMDAFFGGSWRTVLVGGLGGGGQGVYALDVTNPSTIQVLWELNDESVQYVVSKKGEPHRYSDLGYTYSRPNVVRLRNGKWVALFGNGYNSSEQDGFPSDPDNPGRAVLYVVDVETGAIVKTFDTGNRADPLGASRPNGLSTVAPVDENGDYIVDYVYGGDLYGNLWKFDLREASAANWSLTGPLFSTPVETVTGLKKGQPITTRPQVIRHPEGKGLLVLFGTGSYFQVGEGVQEDQATQAFYAIWDNPEANKSLVEFSELQQQIILEEKVDPTTGRTYRITSDYGVDWEATRGWYMNLLPQKLAAKLNTKNFGERQVSDSIVRGGRVIFSTLVPDPDACGFGGEGWLMELDAATGSRELKNASPFLERNGDGVYEMVNLTYKADGKDETQVAPSGRKSSVGIIPAPAILARPGGAREFKYLSGSKADEDTGLNVEVVVENASKTSVGRKSWSQLFK